MRYPKIKDFAGARRQGIGSSDIPVLAGMTSKYGDTPYTLWCQKTGRELPWGGNDRTRWGHKLEGVVLSTFAEGIPPSLFLSAHSRGRNIGDYQLHTEAHVKGKPYLAHADMVGPGYIVEAKTCGLMSGESYNPDDLSSTGIPPSVLLQVQWQLMCYDLKQAYVAVLIDTSDYRLYGPIIALPEIQAKCCALADQFWAHVQKDTPPPAMTVEDLQSLYPTVYENALVVGASMATKIKSLIDLDAGLADTIKDAEAKRDEIKLEIGRIMEDRSALTTLDGEILATRRIPVSRESISLSTLKKNSPDLYANLDAVGAINHSIPKPQVRY